MFEAVITLCLALSDGPCRDQLLPGYEAPDAEQCTMQLQTRALKVEIGQELEARGKVRCVAAGPAMAVEEITPGLFVHMGKVEEPDPENRGDVSNFGFIIGETSVAVIDSGTARWMGEALWRAIRQRTDLPVSHVILSHMHPDHVLGAAPLAQAGALIVGHENLPRALADRQANYLESLTELIGAEAFLGTVAVGPEILISVDMPIVIDLGARLLDLRAWPTAHTGTDITVFDRQSGTLFAGDLVFHRHTPALDGRLLGWQAVLAEMKELAVQRVVPGHGGPALDWPVGAADMTRYLAVLEADTRAAVTGGARIGDAVETIAQSEADNWALFDAYNPRNATVAFTELEWE